MSLSVPTAPHLLVVAIKGQSVTRKVGRLLVQLKVLVQLGTSGLVRVNRLPGLWVIKVKVLHKNQEAPVATLLKQSHQACVIDSKCQITVN